MSRVRIALYSHDTVGLGHMRRNLLVARALAESAMDPAILLIAGNNQANAFAAPPGVDWVTLPAYRKSTEGRYAPGALPLTLRRLVALRARTICAALEVFDPDLVIVDKVPRGVLGELTPALNRLRARGRARWVLGLRDILDEPRVVRREWDESDNEAAVRAFYSSIWVYGDRAVCDHAREYGFGTAVRERLTYTGYLDPRVRLQPGRTPADRAAVALPPRPRILCTVGGGQDGAPVVTAFAAADMPDGANGVVLTGPFIPRRTLEEVRERAEANERLLLLEFVPEAADLVFSADRVVCMAGYNTISEVLCFRKPALVVPRVAPRREQLIRAERLQALGLIDMLHPRHLSAVAISEWLAQPPPPRRHAAVDLGGLSRVPVLAGELLRSDAQLPAVC